MLRTLLRVGTVLTVFVVSAQAADGRGSGVDGLGFSAVENDAISANDLPTTNILKGLFEDWAPFADSDFDAEAADSDPPLTHPISETAERFASDNKVAKAGWGTTLGLLPLPENKLSLPSADVRLQERGVHFGALYRF